MNNRTCSKVWYFLISVFTIFEAFAESPQTQNSESILLSSALHHSAYINELVVIEAKVNEDNIELKEYIVTLLRSEVELAENLLFLLQRPETFKNCKDFICTPLGRLTKDSIKK